MTVTGTAGVTYLDGRRFRRLLLAGIARLARERTHLDRINVFPVPDGDTGTNLTLTFTAIAERLAGEEPAHAGELLAVAADAAIDGARGNSGAIFAQYLQGLARATADQHRVDGAALGRALAAAEESARTALTNPQEGTVLTVMAAVSAAAKDAGGCLETLLANLVSAARRAVESTRTTLDSLRDAGVEDAGARGLLVLLEGMADALRPGTAPPMPLSDSEAPLRIHLEHLTAGPLEHRFCAECVVTATGIDVAALRAELAAIASSVVVVGGGAKVRIHAHVNDPGQVFELARRYGKISAEKADDMARQERSLQTDGRRVAIVSDSAADLPPEVWDEMGIYMVPVRITFGERSYLDKAEMSAADFFRELAVNPEAPKTSQPPPGDYRRAYEVLSSHFEHVVSISITGRLSGTLQAAQTAAGRVARPEKITVLDSRNGSVGQGLIALGAAELAREGLGPEAVIAGVNELAAHTRTYALIPDLKAALRGGRIPAGWRWLARLLTVAFIIATTPEGAIRVRAVVRLGGDRAAALMRVALRDIGSDRPRRVAIAHANSPGDAETLRDGCQQKIPGIRQVLVTELGPAIGVHGGSGTLVLAVQELADG